MWDTSLDLQLKPNRLTYERSAGALNIIRVTLCSHPGGVQLELR
jgi:hypothetical protein